MHAIADDADAIARRMREIQAEEKPHVEQKSTIDNKFSGFSVATGEFLDHLLYYYGLPQRRRTEDDAAVRKRLLDFITSPILKGSTILVPSGYGNGMTIVQP